MTILLKNIHLNFGSKVVLNDLDLAFKANRLNCLLGRSGSGKTSILRIIAGISPGFLGEVYFGNTNITDKSPRDRHIGWVPQEQLLFPGLNIRQNIEYGLIARGFSKEIRDKRVAELVQLIGLEELIDRSPERLSGGERQRVALARALAPEPQVLLLDEPFSSLDAPERDRLAIQTKQIQLETGVTTVHVTHSAKEAELIGDKLFILSKGKIIQEGTVTELFQKPISVEVAKILGINNLIDANTFEDIDYPAIIPDEAIKINQGAFIAKVISATRENIHVALQSDLNLMIKNVNKLNLQPGDEVNVEINKNLLYKLQQD